MQMYDKNMHTKVWKKKKKLGIQIYEKNTHTNV